jgi:chorismate mutase / prephenate dehydratase
MDEKLSELREKIDAADSMLIKGFTDRMKAAAEIAEYKKKNGLPVYDAAREEKKLLSVASLAGEEMGGYTKELYSLLFELSREYQNSLIKPKNSLYDVISRAIEDTPRLFPESAHVVCQGIDGAYSASAARKMFAEPNISFVRSFGDVIRAVKDGYAEFGVLPIENSTAGVVGDVYKELETCGLYICRSVRLKIEHSLLACDGSDIKSISEVVSHEQAIHQCAGYIESLGNVKVSYFPNTAAAARYVKESGRHDIAAIASRDCADIYGLVPLAKDIQDNDNNYTRFICLTKDVRIYPGADKTTVMLTLPDKPGALFKVLSRFSALGINLTSIISRPIEGRDFEFRFFLDFETQVYSDRFAQLISTIGDCCEEFSYLGSYNRA